MPTYDYQCSEGHSFELFQKMSDEPVASCPECGAEARRQISGGAGFLFKGDGFYITDYRSKEYKEKAKADTTKPTSDASTKSSDTKSASKKASGEAKPASAGKKGGSKKGPSGGSKGT